MPLAVSAARVAIGNHNVSSTWPRAWCGVSFLAISAAGFGGPRPPPLSGPAFPRRRQQIRSRRLVAKAQSTTPLDWPCDALRWQRLVRLPPVVRHRSVLPTPRCQGATGVQASAQATTSRCTSVAAGNGSNMRWFLPIAPEHGSWMRPCSGTPPRRHGNGKQISSMVTHAYRPPIGNRPSPGSTFAAPDRLVHSGDRSDCGTVIAGGVQVACSYASSYSARQTSVRPPST